MRPCLRAKHNQLNHLSPIATGNGAGIPLYLKILNSAWSNIFRIVLNVNKRLYPKTIFPSLSRDTLIFRLPHLWQTGGWIKTSVANCLPLEL